MKSLVLILTALTCSTTAGALAPAIHIPNLLDRAIDPSTMNPILFSVLSVLKTGMPTGPNIAMPTGDVEPDWYQRLPGDVKSLLPEFYPVDGTVAATAAAVATSGGVSQRVESTDTVVSVSTITDTASPLSSQLYSNVPSSTTSSTTLPSASATSSNSPSLGARFVAKTEMLAAIAMLSVGAGFVIFA